jgi:hypothetical protein
MTPTLRVVSSNPLPHRSHRSPPPLRLVHSSKTRLPRCISTDAMPLMLQARREKREEERREQWSRLVANAALLAEQERRYKADLRRCAWARRQFGQKRPARTLLEQAEVWDRAMSEGLKEALDE